ncbi:MAG TPA: hypothetical protein PLK63_14445 [Catalimonadaceae bacterium]|nr:hypothetical protein [Catalimonadaceae bacterium]
MNYSWTLITDLVKINQVITFAQKEVKTYSNRFNNKDLQNENSAQNTIDLAEEISETQSELNSVLVLIPTLIPDSIKYREAIGKKMRLESKLYDLQLDSETGGEVALVTGQYNQNRNAAQLAEANKLLSEAQARKVAIEAGN